MGPCARVRPGPAAELAREHLDLAEDGSEDELLIDPQRSWLRPHRPEKLALLTRLWATPVYRLLVDPDGRPVRERLARRF